MLGGVDRDRFQRIPLLHAGFDRQSGTQRQILLRNYRRIGNDRNLAAGVRQNTRGFKRFVAQLKFARMGQRRPDRHRHRFILQLVDDQVTFRHMLQRDLHVEFLRDPQRCENIVGLMGVRLQRQLAMQYRPQRFQLHIVSRQLAFIAARGQHLPVVFSGLQKHFAQLGCRRHPGIVILIFITALRVLAKRAFHRDFLFHDHLIDALADRLDRRERTAQHIRTARSGADGCDAGQRRFTERRIHRIDAVDRAQLRRQDIRHLIAVVALKTNPGAVQADVAMRLDKAWINVFIRRVDDLAVLRHDQILTDRRDLALVRQYVRNIWFLMNRVVHPSVFNTNHSSPSFLSIGSLYKISQKMKAIKIEFHHFHFIYIQFKEA